MKYTHLNAQTKGKNRMSWIWKCELKAMRALPKLNAKAGSIWFWNSLLNKNVNPGQNVLLEFAATLPENADVQQKYVDTIITKIWLKRAFAKRLYRRNYFGI